jgi:hypothetical protein
LLIKPIFLHFENKTPVTKLNREDASGLLERRHAGDSMEPPIMNIDTTNSRAAKSNGTHRNPQRETKIACNSGSDCANKNYSTHCAQKNSCFVLSAERFASRSSGR